MLEKFQPVSTAMEWKLQSIEAQSDAFLVKAHVSKISNLKKEDSAVKSSSLWGYFSNAASHVSEYASSWISGDFVGLASSKIIQCQGPKALPGYLLDINLDQSSYVISSQAKAVQIEVCWETNSKKLLTEISLVLRVLPGFYSSVTATPEVLSQLQVQLEAWADFLSDQVAVEEVKLVQADYAVE
jgi:hypothetical protein